MPPVRKNRKNKCLLLFLMTITKLPNLRRSIYTYIMSKPPFKFKQFSVAQNKCAMKVNTDGVLLGAWQTGAAKTILDVGTGTGVIALMMAQKNATAKIDAIDIDHDAYLQAKENFEQSPWAERLAAHHTPLQNFEPQKLYDLIITNPPYFIDDFKTDNHQKNVARHSTALNFAELLHGINRLLSTDGNACLIITAFNLAHIETAAATHQLHVTALTEVIAVEGKPPYVVLLELSRSYKPISKSSITIQHANGAYTSAYQMLTKDFYLKF